MMSKNNKFDIFNENWKNVGTKKRCVKIKLNLTEEQLNVLEEYKLKYKTAHDFLSKKAFYGLHQGIYDNSLRRGDILKNPLLKTHKLELLQSGLTTRVVRESVGLSVGNRYVGSMRRHDNIPNKIQHFREERGYFISEAKWDGPNQAIGIPIHDTPTSDVNSKNKVKYLWISCDVLYKKKIVKDKLSGYLTKDKDGRHYFTACTTLNIEWKYSPQRFFGIDINKSEAFLAMSKEIDGTRILRRNDRLSYIVNKLRELNKLIKDKNPNKPQYNHRGELIRTKQRKKIRRVISNLNKECDRIVAKILQPVFDYVVRNNLVLCIDPSNTGGSNGNYGQMNAIDILITTCENKEIPFVIVPTPYTSQRCSQCGKHGLRKKELFNCPECGYGEKESVDVKFFADLNASCNIIQFGEYIWKNGYEKFAMRYVRDDNNKMTFIDIPVAISG